ncbi:aminopeptidase P family protein [Candidatus Neomarinimicrobiota bacterium]
MQKVTPVFLVMILFLGCEKEILVPVEQDEDNAAKIKPYEEFYDAATFAQRRNDLVSTLPADALILVVTNDSYLSSGEENYDFRPAQNFYYLTGFEETDAAIVLRRKSTADNTAEMIMFVQERSATEVQWLGPVYGPAGAIEFFGADSAYNIDLLGPVLDVYNEQMNYQSMYSNLAINRTVVNLLETQLANLPVANDIDETINPMRVIKSDVEIEAIRSAVDVSVQAFTEALPIIEPGIYEYEVDAMMQYIANLNGCERLAFGTIVASGENINALHYDANVSQMYDGDLVMIDYGAEYAYYASDVTRTVPVNGTYTDKQTRIYNIVLEAYNSVIESITPGVNYYDLYSQQLIFIIDRLIEYEIITGNRDDILSSRQYRQYVVGGLGHPVGLYVHDPFPWDAEGVKTLRENMVMAIEPHIYLNEGDQTVDPDYWGISARIEDTVLITATGVEILSAELPNTVAELEQLMR